MVYKIKYYAYLLKNINIGFFTFRIKVGSGAGSVFFSAEPDPDTRKKMSDPHPCMAST